FYGHSQSVQFAQTGVMWQIVKGCQVAAIILVTVDHARSYTFKHKLQAGDQYTTQTHPGKNACVH
ncbi:MAG: hypothetical protein ACF8OB_02275, partial [Phycisphaeraceae bacterium JB051]